MSYPEISVIVPVYNVQKHLATCLDSIIKQTFTDIEIICINDGSTDDSLKILQQYAAIDQRIHIISQDNAGLSAARNTGLEAAHGKYISFIDSDDYLDKEFLVKTHEAIKNHPVDFVVSGVQAFPESDKDNNRCVEMQKWFDKYHQPEGVYDCHNKNNNNSSTATGKLFSHDLIKKHDLKFPYKNLIHEDEFWTWIYRVHSQNYYYIPTPLYFYRIHSSSITGSEKQNPRALDIIDIQLLTAKEFQRFELAEQHLPSLEWVFNRNITNALIKCGAHYYEMARKKMSDYLNIAEFSDNFRNNIAAYVDTEIPVSVIVPVYNTAPYLPCCLDSLLAQTTDLFEIICVNDGSTDNSLEILQQYAQRDQRIKIISQPNKGLPTARNAGLEIARGKYIMFVDSDDFVEPQMIETTFIHMQNHNLDHLLFRLRKYDPQTKKFHLNPYHDLPNDLPYFSIHRPDKEFQLMVTLPQEVCNKCYRRELINQHGIKFNAHIRQGEDEIFNLTYLVHTKKCGMLKEYLYNYRHPRDGSIMTTAKNYTIDNFKGIFDLLEGIYNLVKQQSSACFANGLTYRYLLHIKTLCTHYPVYNNYYCYRNLRKLLKKHKSILRGRTGLNAEIGKKVKRLLRQNYLIYKMMQTKKHLMTSTAGNIINDVWCFIKAYFLFPWYIYKIYKILKNKK